MMAARKPSGSRIHHPITFTEEDSPMPVKNRLISSVSSLPSQFFRHAEPLRQAKPVAALVLLCFCLFALPNSPNLAQGGYPGGGGYPGAGEWTLSLEFTDNRWTSSQTPTSGTFSIAPGSEASGSKTTSGNPVTHDPGTTSISLSAVPVLRWHSSTGAPPPPDKLRIKVSAYVESWASAVNTDTGGSVSASNGFDASVGTASQVKSQGSHLLQKDNAGRSTEVRFPAVTLSGSATGIVDSSGQGYGSYCWWSINVVQDNREVAIASDGEPNYGRGVDALGNWVAVPNVRRDDGGMFIDSVAPFPLDWATGNDPVITQIKYSPIYSRGAWGSNSTYSWSSTLGGNLSSGSRSGTFNAWWPNLEVDIYGLTYTNPPADSGRTDVIRLKLTDGADGTVAENTYSVVFHTVYDDFEQTFYDKTPATLPNHTDPPGVAFHEVTTIPGPASHTEGMSTTIELGSEWSIEGGTGSEALEKLLTLKASYKHTDRETKTVSSSTTWGPIPADEVWTFWAASQRIHRGGPCSKWGENGYLGQRTWDVTETPDGAFWWYTIRHVGP